MSFVEATSHIQNMELQNSTFRENVQLELGIQREAFNQEKKTRLFLSKMQSLIYIFDTRQSKETKLT